MGRKLGAKSWAIRRNPNLLCEVCKKEPAWAFGWQMVPEQTPVASVPWPEPMSAAQLLNLPADYTTPKTTAYHGRLVGDCTNNSDYYDVTFQAFMTQDTPQDWIEHVGRKLWCNHGEWLDMVKRSHLLDPLTTRNSLLLPDSTEPDRSHRSVDPPRGTIGFKLATAPT